MHYQGPRKKLAFGPSSNVGKWIGPQTLSFNVDVVCSPCTEKEIKWQKGAANTWRRIEQGKDPCAPSPGIFSGFFQGYRPNPSLNLSGSSSLCMIHTGK
jgi:hypothetical protein